MLGQLFFQNGKLSPAPIIAVNNMVSVPSNDSRKPEGEGTHVQEITTQQLFEKYVQELSERSSQDSDDNALSDNQLRERYIEESEKLKELSSPFFERFVDSTRTVGKGWKVPTEERWRTEYDQLLFKAAKLAMKRVT
ncbi:MAG: hypothetical protein FWE67_05125 [Planctomycetaceae bacterium]|nr:hypothetical protein [Planctomycetaceae bacterium]